MSIALNSLDAEPGPEFVKYKKEFDDDEICSCCLAIAGGHLINMHDSFDNNGKHESYIDVVNQCYNSQILNPDEPPGKHQICDDCLDRLNDSCKFKRQITEAQKSLRELFNERDVSCEVKGDLVGASQKVDDFMLMNCSNIKADSIKQDSDHEYDQGIEFFGYEPAESQGTFSIRASPRTKNQLKKTKNRESRDAQKSIRQSTKSKIVLSKSSKTSMKSKSVNEIKRPSGRPRKANKPRKPFIKHSDKASYSAMDKDNKLCRVCEKTFPSVHLLRLHINEHFVNYTCDECGKGFATSNGFAEHKRRHIVGGFKCTCCDKTFDTVTRLQYHRLKHRTGKYECRHCKALCMSYYFLKKHLIKEHGYGYPCKMCNATFINPSKRLYHFRLHHETRERKHRCEYCEKQFYEEAHLRLHVVLHTGEKNFVCFECNKAFAWKKNLVTHMRIHNNERNYVCAQCGVTFIQKSSLDWHLRKHGAPLEDL